MVKVAVYEARSFHPAIGVTAVPVFVLGGIEIVLVGGEPHERTAGELWPERVPALRLGRSAVGVVLSSHSRYPQPVLKQQAGGGVARYSEGASRPTEAAAG